MNNSTTILAIDDELNNLRIISLDLEDEEYTILTAENGQEGWNILQERKSDIKVILLDRMMPGMNGIEFMEKLKNDESVANIPVIMQTAAAEKEQVVEGIKAGVYYYLTKPYDKDVMLSIIKAAINDYGQYSQMRQDLKQFKRKLNIVKECNFEVQQIDDAKYLATFLANFYPDPERVIFGITELIINAVEHGNLGITYEEKSKLQSDFEWHKEIERRQQLDENRTKRVFVHYAKQKSTITLTIKDDGDGFEWQEYIEISPDRATHNHGRGIALSKVISFDKLEYNDKGNKVVCTVNL